MAAQRALNSSSLSLFIFLSIGIHIIGASLFVLLKKETPNIKSIEIVIQQPVIASSARSATSRVITPVQNTVAPTRAPQEIPKPVVQREVVQRPKPVIQKEIVQPPKPVTTPKPVVQKEAVQPPKPVATPKPVAQKEIVQPPKSVATPKPVVQKEVVPPPKPVAIPTPVVQKEIAKPKTSPPVEQKDLSHEIDKLLAKKSTETRPADFLSDAKWSGSPRRTILFPNLTASIPQRYKTRGYGFSVTAKLTFSHQGWVSSVELLQGSGDPRIDGIFRTELRKIRIEPSKNTDYDTVVKTFKVSVK